MKIVSLFSGCGGLDLGFTQAGFNVVWANEYDKTIWQTYEVNHKSTLLDKRSIRDVVSDEVPNCDGIIGGPPCQSWSGAGTLRGINDARGKLFYDFIRLLKAKQPKFFLAENVSGMLAKRNIPALNNIKSLFGESGYNLFFSLLNAKDYGVPQDRKRVFFIGFRKDLKINYSFPSKLGKCKVLKDAIYNFGEALPSGNKNHTNSQAIQNHEYMTGNFSTIYMSRNRVRTWDEPSFTIQAGGRHAPIHPSAPKMTKVSKDKFQMQLGHEHFYRRLTVRECAAIQTFPDNFVFLYKNISDGYKMVGNAVPVKLANVLAKSIKIALNEGQL